MDPDRGRESSAGDRQIIEAWIRDNPTIEARLTEANDPADGSWRSLRPHGATSRDPFFIVNVSDHHEMVRARAELAVLVTTPENLRVRRWKPSKAEVDRVQAWIWEHNRPFDETKTSVTATGPHPTSGLLMISLNRVDREYAEELEEATHGLAYVQPEPETIIPLRADASASGDPPHGRP
ncbi:hypothetical protein OHB24_21110 [Kribbella sp. NBC_00482]|uniref:hypothetical protein n=1 Tax=Kribbella sp. NBC_00482 TaxID=2975968 RepID=UPI002E187C74